MSPARSRRGAKGPPPAPRIKVPPVSSRALLLKRTPYGESSLVVHALTPGHGRVELIAKGAHRLKSRFSGVLDWFDTLFLDWAPPRGEAPGRGEMTSIGALRMGPGSGPGSGLSTLRTGDVDQRRRWITSSLETYRAAHTAIELTELSTRAGFADADLFTLLAGTLDEFNAVGRALSVADDGSVSGLLAPLPLRLARFELRLLGCLGLQPSLAACAACGGPAPAVTQPHGAPRAAFSPEAGGRLCAEHAGEAHGAGHRVGTLPVDVLDGAHALIEPGSAATSQRELLTLAEERPEFGDRILDFTGRFLDHQLETRPKSQLEFLGAADRNSRAKLAPRA